MMMSMLHDLIGWSGWAGLVIACQYMAIGSMVLFFVIATFAPLFCVKGKNHR